MSNDSLTLKIRPLYKLHILPYEQIYRNLPYDLMHDSARIMHESECRMPSFYFTIRCSAKPGPAYSPAVEPIIHAHWNPHIINLMIYK